MEIKIPFASFPFVPCPFPLISLEVRIPAICFSASLYVAFCKSESIVRYISFPATASFVFVELTTRELLSITRVSEPFLPFS